MVQQYLTLFETSLGRCGLAWGEHGIVAASFPAGGDDKTCARMRRRAKSAIETDERPAYVQRLISDIAALFEGERKDLSRTSVDRSGFSNFDDKVFDLTLEIPPGELKTYGELARTLGDVGLSRRVGQSLGRNPIPIIIPCHRVVGADGAMTGFSAPGGTVTKKALLKIEGALEPDLFD